MHLIPKGLDIAECRVFSLENCLICNVKIEESLLSQIIATQSLSLFLKNFGESGHELFGLVLVGS